MRSAIASAAAACILLCGEAGVFGREAVLAWGKPVNGLRAGLAAPKTKFDAGDRDWVRLVLHLRNDGKQKVTLPWAGAEHGWRWKFKLVGGGKPLIPRWDDDTAGQRAAPPSVVLGPGAAKTVPAAFRQRSFMKLGCGGFCSLVPGKYHVSASYSHPSNARAPKGRRRGKLTTGVVQIEIARRGDAWDKVATADAAALVALLGNKDRRLAAAAKAFLTEKGKGAVAALIKGLSHNHAGVRAECAGVLGSLRQDAQPAVTALAKALTDTDPHVRVAAATALGRIGPAAKAAVPALLRAVKEDRSTVLPSVRPPAAAALGWIGDARGEVVAALADLLKDKMIQHDDNRYAEVAHALGRLGPKAAGAVPVLAEQLQDKNNRQRRYALRCLGSIGPAAAPALIRLLADEQDSMQMRVGAAHTLGRFGPAAKDAAAVLEKLRAKYRSDPKAKPLCDAADAAIKNIRKTQP